MRTRSLAALFLALAPSAPALAMQSFFLEVQPGASSLSLENEFSVLMPGSLIGDWDASANPGGTQTRPGLFGGGPNDPIPTSFRLFGETSFAGPPLGSFAIEIDRTILAVAVSELDLDLLGGATAVTDITLGLLYDTFRTFQPTSLFPGGIELPIPLGQQTLAELKLTQSGRSTGGILVPGGSAGSYSFTTIVPAELSFVVDLLGTVVPVGPLPIALPLAGTVQIAGNDALVSLAFDIALDQSIDDPLPGFTVDDLPFDVPTLLPPGQVAHLLLSFAIASLGVTLDTSLAIVAGGSAPCGFESYCLSAPNSGGQAARLFVSGIPDAFGGTLDFLGDRMPAGQMALLVMAPGEGFVPSYAGHRGNLCVGPRFFRFAAADLHVGPDGSLSYSPDFDRLPNGMMFLPGTTWRFQLWYRDLDPLPTWNSTTGVRVRFCSGG